MRDLIELSKAQMRRIEPHFPLSHGMPRVDDQRMISGIIFMISNDLRWRDAPREYGPHKTIYNRFIQFRPTSEAAASSIRMTGWVMSDRAAFGSRYS